MAYSIYVADDEKNIRELLKSFLESDGYSVSAFETGDKLLEAFDKEPCDLVILDVMMPGTDGTECVKRLRNLIIRKLFACVTPRRITSTE